MLTVRQAKQILAKGCLLLGLLIGAGCLPDQGSSVETPIPTAAIGETAVATIEALLATPTLAAPAVPTSTPTHQDTQTPAGTVGDPVRIQFEPGASSETITGPLDSQNQARYVFWAETGQTAVINVTSPNNGVLFHLEGSSDGQVYKHLLDGESEWQGVSPVAQDYLLVLDAVGGPTTYTVFISIGN